MHQWSSLTSFVYLMAIFLYCIRKRNGELPRGKSDNAGSVEDFDGNGQSGLELLMNDQQWIILAVPTVKQNLAKFGMTRQKKQRQLEQLE